MTKQEAFDIVQNKLTLEDSVKFPEVFSGCGKVNPAFTKACQDAGYYPKGENIEQD